MWLIGMWLEKSEKGLGISCFDGGEGGDCGFERCEDCAKVVDACRVKLRLLVLIVTCNSRFGAAHIHPRQLN